jgi:hypothetical protein
MAKTNRGDTTKLSIRLTKNARTNIETIAKNLNLSKAGVILFALSHILRKPPSKSSVFGLEQKYNLEPQNLALTVTTELAARVDALKDIYDGMKKNRYVGLLVSDFFENQKYKSMLSEDKDTTPKKIALSINKELKKKMDSFSEMHYVPLSGIIAYCILNGAVNYFPVYNDSESEQFFTRIPKYLSDEVKRQSALFHITESFYVELCLYRAFMSEELIFEV